MGGLTTKISGIIAAFAAISLVAGTCPQADDASFVQYFYGPSDATVLKDQQCENTTAVAAQPVGCRCYDETYPEVLTKLESNSGPVGVTTRKISKVFTEISCKEALQRCEDECRRAVKEGPADCSQLVVPGIGVY